MRIRVGAAGTISPAGALDAAGNYGAAARVRGAAAASLLLVAAATGLQAAASLQSAGGVETATAVDPDTVLVGQPFEVGIAVRAPAGAEVRFPVAPAPGEYYEALAPVSTSHGPQGWTARYRLVSWRAGEPDLPSVTVALLAGGDVRELDLELPAPHVVSVLPDRGELQLRAPRPPFEGGASIWLWLLLGLIALALLAYALRRDRGAAAAPPERRDVAPADSALAELARVRSEVESGEKPPHVGYDEADGIAGRYWRTTRGAPPGRPLALDPQILDGARGSGAVAASRERAARVRFGRMDVWPEEALADLDAWARWIEADAGAER